MLAAVLFQLEVVAELSATVLKQLTFTEKFVKMLHLT
jgi:hypothetical protein